MPVVIAPNAVDQRAAPPAAARSRAAGTSAGPCRLVSVNAMNTPTVYSGISAETLPRRRRAARPRPARARRSRVERQAVAAELEHARQEAVAGEDARQPREIGERGVRGEHQRAGPSRLDEQVDGVPAPTRVAVSWLTTVCCSLGSGRMPTGREEADAQEDHGEEPCPSSMITSRRSALPAG